MTEILFETVAYAKIILHAAKYPHCAINGVLLGDGTKVKDGAKTLEIVDVVPLFHHSHYVSPMAEVALTQIEAVAQADNRMIVGYYAACENVNDNTIEKCPGQKIADKIIEHFPAAFFVVVDNKKLTQNLESPALKLHKYTEGKWKLKDTSKSLFQTPYALETVSHLMQRGVYRDLVDFDNYLDDVSQDWTNLGIEKLIASINAANTVQNKNN